MISTESYEKVKARALSKTVVLRFKRLSKYIRYVLANGLPSQNVVFSKKVKYKDSTTDVGIKRGSATV
jgi:hypothetical protein